MNPTVAATIGDGAVVNVNNTLTVEATSVRAEADAKATAGGGGGISFSAANGVAHSTPTVTASIGKATINAGQDVIVTAAATAVGDPGNFGDTFDAADVNTTSDTIHFRAHGLVDGDTVHYDANGGPIGTPGGNLASPRDFTVLKVDADTLKFGAPFTSDPGDAGSLFDPTPGVDSTYDVIRFGVRHNFQDGDAVRYDPEGNGLINTTLNTTDTYYVRVIDPFTIKLTKTKAEALAAPTNFTTADVNSLLDYIHLSGFSDGDAVTYRTRGPVLFETEGINSGSETITLNATGDHGLQSGDTVTYFRDNPGGTPNIGVNNGAVRYVHRISATQISLYDTQAHAIAGGPTGLVDLTRTGADRNLHALVLKTMGNDLVNGETYYVVNSGAFGSNTFQLATCTVCSPIGLDTSEVTGTHTLGIEGIELTPATGTQSLFIDFTSAGGNGQSLLGPNGVSLRTISPPPGNGISESSGGGGDGGGIAGGNPDGTTYITHNVRANIVGGLVRAGHDVVITATTAANGSAYGSSGAGGFVQIGNANVDLEFSNTTLAYIGVDNGGGNFDATGDISRPVGCCRSTQTRPSTGR